VSDLHQNEASTVKHRTSFKSVAHRRCYVPICSCGFRGAAVSSAVAALAAANAHARAQGVEPLPPEAR
jgi:hypothetical protein